MSGKVKPHLNLIIIGHVDHGKSTSIGHLFYDAGAISEKVIRDFEEEAKALGKESFKYAWVLDKLKEERERGLTIDLAFYKLESDKHFFTVIDSPGHRDFVKNMVTGASQADGAVIFISAKRGEYGMTRLLKQVGYNTDKIHFVPTSGWTGDNLYNRSEKMDWYKGPTVIEALDMFEVPSKPVDKPLRIPVQEVYSIRGVGTVPVGKIETGTLKMDSTLIFMPSKEQGQVKTIETHYTRMNEAGPGDNIGFNVKGIARDKIKRGDVAGYLNDVPKVAKSFDGRIFIIHHPTAVAEGYTPVLHIHTAQIAVRFDKLISKIDPRSGQVVEENPSYLRTGDAAVVRLVPLQPVALEKYTDFPQLGRFALRDMGTTIGAGVVLEVEE